MPSWRTATGCARCARRASASPARSTMDLRRLAPCSSSRLSDRVGPAGLRARRPAGPRPMEVARVFPYYGGQGVGLRGRSLQGAFAMATRTDNEIRELSPEEWDQRVDEQARKRLGMSGEEFERRLNAGEIDIDDSPDVTRVAMRLPLHATRK